MSARLILGTVLALSISLYPQTAKTSETSENAVTLADLGLRYTPPADMVDKTAPATLQAREHANSYSLKSAELLLDLSSDEADDSPSWHQIWMFHFPRAQLKGLSEWASEAKVNSALAGPRAQPVGQPASAVFDGHTFLVSEFEQIEPPLKKHAKVYTTVCRTQLVSFVFVANSADPIKGMENSLKSLSFSGK
ncbi:MAG TPA: hypothetical protein VE866_04965 [Candidatus Binatia bacterium]|nr:hypothetical protein [Candidatus Binatia bacterium]